jgi:large subunit ribosomal protein L10
MDRAQKAEAVEDLRGVFGQAGVVVVAHYSGLTVADITTLRGKLREQNASLKVVKNRLAKIALQGTPGEVGSDLFKGPVAIAYSDDPTAATKVAVDYAKGNDKFVLIGGMMEKEVFDAAGVEALSKMPSREELIGTIIARVNGQAAQVIQRLTGQGAGLAGAIKVIGEKAAA